MLSGFLKSKVVYKFVSLLVLPDRLAPAEQPVRLVQPDPLDLAEQLVLAVPQARLAPQVLLVLPDRPALPVRMAKTATPVQQRPSALAP